MENFIENDNDLDKISKDFNYAASNMESFVTKTI
jgi:hypothetical protein